ncbi:MAG: DNA polymerase bacteriophage-type [Parcubacteria group bacterium Gr01-1014_29]|nr:MAG: DNA polymerase bacteriophage-type [Parcubacteria group bacterium Gr01-1014_29]
MPTKQQLLDELKKEMEENTTLPLSDTANFVFGEGDADAEVLFIGEAPGFHENQQQRPFVGLAGQLLDKLLGEINWPRESVYITNIVKRRPPENRDPLPEEIEVYAPYLKRQIEILQPKTIATLGRFSMNYFLPETKISRDHGRLLKASEQLIYPLYHPAAALRSTAVLEDLRKDFHKLPHILATGTMPFENRAEAQPYDPVKEEPKAQQDSLF